MKRGDCGCRNHMGTRKNKYASKELALDFIMARHLRSGIPHEAYPCPRMEDVWHIRSKREKAAHAK